MREMTLRVERRTALRHPAVAGALLVLRAPRLSPVPLALRVVDFSTRGLGVRVPTGSLLVEPGTELEGLYATTGSGQAWVGRAAVSRADVVPGPHGPWLHLGLELAAPAAGLGGILGDDRPGDPSLGATAAWDERDPIWVPRPPGDVEGEADGAPRRDRWRYL